MQAPVRSPSSNKNRMEGDSAGEFADRFHLVRLAAFRFLAPLLMPAVVPAVPLIGRVLSNPDQFFDRLFKKHLRHVAERFSQAIREALPELAPDEAFWRLFFMAGCMTQVLALSSVLPLMSSQPVDRDVLMRRLTTFVTAGLRAPVAVSNPVRKES